MVVKGLQMTDAERAAFIADAQQTILQALDEIRQAVRGTDHEGAAERMVLANIECSATRDHGWLDRSTNLDDVIRWFELDQLDDDTAAEEEDNNGR